MQASEKMMNARCRLLTRIPYYGHLAMGMTWHQHDFSFEPNEDARTMGVRIVNGGEVQCIYYGPFVDKLSQEECYAVIQHELEHVMRCHCIRVSDRHPLAWNIAADMTINGPRSNPRIGYKDANGSLIIPMKNEIIWIPEDWEKDCSSEEYYSRLMKNQKNVCPKCGKMKGGAKDKGDSGGGQDGDGDSGGEQGTGKGGKGGKSPGKCGGSCDGCGAGEYAFGDAHGKAIDNHSVWNQSDVGADEARQVVHDLVQQAVQKSQGNVPGHVSELLKKLAKPVVRWREMLRQYLGRHVGNRRTTYSRASRRFSQFGIPGTSTHAAATVNVIVDTSGSVSTDELQRFFAEIESIAYRAKINVLLWDHDFQGFGPYKRGAWKNFKVNGRGGTDMAAPIKYLMDKKLIADVQVMFTDGECNYAPKQEFPMITVISRGKGYGNEPGWGQTVFMAPPKD